MIKFLPNFNEVEPTVACDPTILSAAQDLVLCALFIYDHERFVWTCV